MQYNEQLQRIAKNLSTLNNIYELQLQSSQANADASVLDARRASISLLSTLADP
jgi:hypothetical protein